MTIALSAVIRPSAMLRIAHAALCLAVLACAVWAISISGVAAALLFAGSLAGAAAGRGLVKLARIDISAVGQIRLTVYHQRDAPRAEEGQRVRLLPGSTLWPGLLLLRLQNDSARVHWLAVLPDSAAPDVRRRLALAARAIAARGGADNAADRAADNAAGSAAGAKKNPSNP